MEARLSFGGFNGKLVLVVAALVVLVAAMAAGYGIRAATGSKDTDTVYVASGGTAPAAQSDAPCVWSGTTKGC